MEQNNNQAIDLEKIEEKAEEVKEVVENVAEKTIEFAKDVKEKYDEATPEQQEKVKKGILGGLTALATIIGLKKIFKKRK